MWQIKKYSGEVKDIKQELIIKPATRKEYNKLKHFHYINEKLPVVKYIFGLYYKDFNKNILVGIIVYSFPALNTSFRNLTKLHTIRKYFKSKSKWIKYINNNIVSISRIIIHPSVRGIGLSKYLIDKTIYKIPERYIEITAEMLYFYKFIPNYFFYAKRKIVMKPKEYISSKIHSPYYSSNAYLKKRLNLIRYFGYGFLDKKKLNIHEAIKNGKSQA